MYPAAPPRPAGLTRKSLKLIGKNLHFCCHRKKLLSFAARGGWGAVGVARREIGRPPGGRLPGSGCRGEHSGGAGRRIPSETGIQAPVFLTQYEPTASCQTLCGRPFHAPASFQVETDSHRVPGADSSVTQPATKRFPLGRTWRKGPGAPSWRLSASSRRLSSSGAARRIATVIPAIRGIVNS